MSRALVFENNRPHSKKIPCFFAAFFQTTEKYVFFPWATFDNPLQFMLVAKKSMKKGYQPKCKEFANLRYSFFNANDNVLELGTALSCVLFPLRCPISNNFELKYKCS